MSGSSGKASNVINLEEDDSDEDDDSNISDDDDGGDGDDDFNESDEASIFPLQSRPKSAASCRLLAVPGSARPAGANKDASGERLPPPVSATQSRRLSRDTSNRGQKRR